MYLRLKGTVCDGCQHINFGEVPDLGRGHFSNWKCRRYAVLIGENKGAGQKPFPKTCKAKKGANDGT